jgi:hypothetical protein
MLQKLNIHEIYEKLWEIMENGDMYGYENSTEGEYYREYKELFDDLAAGAYSMEEVLNDYGLAESWDDMTVGLLGDLYTVYGYDSMELDYFKMVSEDDEEYAVQEAKRRLMKLTKEDLIRQFKKVLTTLVFFFDLKSAHDCLTAIVQELDERGAILEEKNNVINRLYEDLTGKDGDDFDEIVKNIPQRMWVE